MTALTLFQVAAEHRALVDRLMETDHDAQTIADTIEAESYPLEVKAQSVAYAIRNLDSLAAQIKEAEKQMADRRKSVENQAARLREYLLRCMELANVQRIDCAHFGIAVRANPASVEIFEPAMIPQEFMRQPEPPPAAPDKTAIKEALKAGKDVPGAVLVQAKRVEIK